MRPLATYSKAMVYQHQQRRLIIPQANLNPGLYRLIDFVIPNDRLSAGTALLLNGKG